jgi:hypothetical protein
MEILAKSKSDSPALLSNAEVMELLNQRIKERKEKEGKLKRRKKHNNKYKHRDWIEDHVFEYLQQTPCVNLDASKRNQLKSKLMSTKKKPSANGKSSKKPSANGKSSKITGFGLTEAESLQVLNFMPQEKVEIHLMVEELHARMSEERQDELLELIKSHLVEIKFEKGKRGTENEELYKDLSIEEEEQIMPVIKEEI